MKRLLDAFVSRIAGFCALQTRFQGHLSRSRKEWELERDLACVAGGISCASAFPPATQAKRDWDICSKF